MSRMLERLIGEHIAIDLRLASDLWPVRADAAQLEQVLVNLALNARDAMLDGGELTIETSNVTLTEPRLRAEGIGLKPGFYVMLSIADTGTGMDAATRQRAFEPFFTTKPQGKGTGLGLATVYGIVKDRQGDVWVYSELGRGSIFKVYLPRVEAAGEPRPVEASAPAVDLSGTETVLVVEDNAMLRTVARETLATAGYKVLEAGDAYTALRIAKGHKGAIDLLVTDVVMPGLNGRELADRLLKQRPGLRVLFMSGYTNDAVVQQRVLQGDAPFLSKPFTPLVLLRKTAEVLGARTARPAPRAVKAAAPKRAKPAGRNAKKPKRRR